MEKVVSMTAAEIRKNFDVKKAIAMIKTAPEFDDPNPNGKVIARGLDEFREYLKRKEQHKAPKPKNAISFSVAPDLLKRLRATGRGWQTRVNNYLAEGLKKGKLAAR